MEEIKGLTRQLKKGNRLAFTAVYMKFHKMMYGFSYSYLCDREWAEDCVQWLFLRLWENRAQLNENLNLQSYLFTSLKNHLLNELRDSRRLTERLTNYSKGVDVAEESGVEQFLQDEDMRCLLAEAISRLSPQKRRICELKIKEELSNTEIAERLDISVNTVKFQYNQIIKDLRRTLEPDVLLILLIFLCF